MTLTNGGRSVVALYWDFENVHAGLLELERGPEEYHRTRYLPQEPIVDLGPVVRYASSLGDIAIHRAYGNWQYFGRYRTDLLQHAVDLVQLFPPGRNGKNGADIRLSLDVIQDIQRFPHVTHVVVVAGDSDYISLAQKCRQAGRVVIGVGVQGTVNQHWEQACNEFKYYRTLRMVGGPLTDSQIDELSEEHDPDEARHLLVTAVDQLARSDFRGAALKAAVKPLMVRLDPSFDERNYGFDSFSALLQAASGLVHVEHGEHDHLLRLTEAGAALLTGASAGGAGAAPRSPTAPQVSDPKRALVDSYERILRRGKIRLVEPELRAAIVTAFGRELTLAEQSFSSFPQVDGAVHVRLEREGTPCDIGDVRKVRYAMFRFRMFAPCQEGERAGSIGLSGGLTGEQLTRRFENSLALWIAQFADPPVDPEALDLVLNGHLPEGEPERRERIRQLVTQQPTPN